MKKKKKKKGEKERTLKERFCEYLDRASLSIYQSGHQIGKICLTSMSALDKDSVSELETISFISQNNVNELVSLRFEKDVCGHIDVISSLHKCLSGRVPVEAHGNQFSNRVLWWLYG